MDSIFLRAVRLEAMIGIYKRERTTTQPVEIDLDITLASNQVFRTGRVADTIDYAVVVARLKKELAEVRFGLVEEMAERIAAILIGEFHSPRVRISISKLGILKDVARVGVVIYRSATPSEATPGGFASGSDPFAISDTNP
ncbi:MAG: dihydroneopterin aldolase [Burkholderiales bacterium]